MKTPDWVVAARESIKQARKFADANEVAYGWFVLRDLEATKHAGMSDLAWSGHKYGVTLNELRWFIGALEHHLDEQLTNPPLTRAGK